MLTPAMNERLTRVGPGTPCGELMRRYWIPIGPYAQLLENPVRKVRFLGEDLILYRDKSNGLGLIGDRCLHRSVDMQFGIPDECGLRCPYHGWLYGATGECLDRVKLEGETHFVDLFDLTEVDLANRVAAIRHAFHKPVGGEHP